MILIYEKGKKGSIEVIAEDLQARLEGYGIDIHKESYDLGECMMAADESKVYMSGKKRSRSRGFEICYDIQDSGSEFDSMTYDELYSRFLWEKYVVVIASDELFSEAEGLIKLDIAMQLFQSCNITVFTIYNDRILKKIPKRAEWLEKTYLLNIPKNMDLQNVAAAIAKIYWRDRLSVQKSKGNDIYTDNVRRSKLCIDTVLSNILADNATCDDELTAMNYCMLDMIKNL